jgi:acetyltransferase
MEAACLHHPHTAAHAPMRAATSLPGAPALPAPELWPLPGGRQVVLRSAQLQDTALARGLLQRLSARSHRRRFHGRLPALGAAALSAPELLADPRHQAVVGVVYEAGCETLVGDARFVCDGHQSREAEFAIVVCDSLRRQGLGRALMLALLQLAADRGVRWLRGEVHVDNPAMVTLLHSLGFTPARCDEAGGLMVFEARIRPGPA